MEKAESYNKRLLELLAGMQIIDSHEHLPGEDDRITRKVDFSLFFSHYCRADLTGAGMPYSDLNKFFNADVSIEEKWRLVSPYLHFIEDGSYWRAARIAMEKIYNVKGLSALADAEKLTEEIRKANEAGLYRRVLKDACNIRITINYRRFPFDPEFFRPVLFVTPYVEVTKATIRDFENSLNVCCGNLTAYVEAIRERLRKSREQGMIGIKFHLAYMRDLQFLPRSTSEAEKVYDRVLEEGYGRRKTPLGYDEIRPLQDYLVHRMIEMADEMDIPVVFHTGLQGDIDQKPDDARPTRLWNLPHRYPGVDFVFLHCGMPWVEDAALPAKHFPNVYLDMSWVYLMSPEIAKRAICGYVDLLPANKVIGFGGDYGVVEKIYGHLILARQALARAFASKMEKDEMSFSQAESWLQAILYENPKRIFRLDV